MSALGIKSWQAIFSTPKGRTLWLIISNRIYTTSQEDAYLEYRFDSGEVQMNIKAICLCGTIVFALPGAALAQDNNGAFFAGLDLLGVTAPDKM